MAPNSGGNTKITGIKGGKFPLTVTENLSGGHPDASLALNGMGAAISGDH